MNKFAPWLPIKPYKLNQGWGTLDPADYEQFGFTRHNGVDYRIGFDSIVYAPFNGHVYQNGYQPNGGGIFCGFLSDEEFDFDAFECETPDNVKIHFPAGKYRVLMDFLHLKSISAVEGQPYTLGDVLAVQDNTGFSTGPHTHVQPRRVTYDGKQLTFVDQNDAHGSFDPTSFWNMRFAEDYQLAEKALDSATEIAINPKLTPEQKASIIPAISKLIAFIKSYFHFN